MTGRNGAWPWRPGKEAVRQHRRKPEKVAMEPGRGGQEKRRTPAWGFCRRPVAMEPGRGGQEKPSPDTPGPHGRVLVAMEPGRGGQEKNRFYRNLYDKGFASQWSLALAARKRSG